jgi:hypothetical protein
MQERNIIVKALDFYYRNKSKLDSFLMLMDIYILFNTYLFGTETTKIVYTINYFYRISFNWIKIYIVDFMAHKFVKNKITTVTRTTTQEMFTSYKKFKNNMRQVFGDIE